MIPPRSSVSRILSASAASWVRIGVTVVTQIALVALYLQAADDIKKMMQLGWQAVNSLQFGLQKTIT